MEDMAVEAILPCERRNIRLRRQTSSNNEFVRLDGAGGSCSSESEFPCMIWLESGSGDSRAELYVGVQIEVLGKIVEILMHRSTRNMVTWLQTISLRNHGKVAELVRPHEVIRFEARVQPFSSPGASHGLAFVDDQKIGIWGHFEICFGGGQAVKPCLGTWLELDR